MEFVLGGAIGFLASLVAAFIFERFTAPHLAVRVVDGRAEGDNRAFYHLAVHNVPPPWLALGRKPAFLCRATLDVFDESGRRINHQTIHARWSTRPEPLQQVVVDGQVRNVLDPARLFAARTIEVFSHHPENIPVLIKHEGEHACHVFSNESYMHPRWGNPEWALDIGVYRLRLRLFYERGTTEHEFRIHNDGPQREHVRLSQVGPRSWIHDCRARCLRRLVWLRRQSRRIAGSKRRRRKSRTIRGRTPT